MRMEDRVRVQWMVLGWTCCEVGRTTRVMTAALLRVSRIGPHQPPITPAEQEPRAENCTDCRGHEGKHNLIRANSRQRNTGNEIHTQIYLDSQVSPPILCRLCKPRDLGESLFPSTPTCAAAELTLSADGQAWRGWLLVLSKVSSNYCPELVYWS